MNAYGGRLAIHILYASDSQLLWNSSAIGRVHAQHVSSGILTTTWDLGWTDGTRSASDQLDAIDTRS